MDNGPMDITQELEARLAQVRERVAAAARRAGRRPEQVELIAVSKTIAAEQVAALARLGVRHCGENRVEEAEAKVPAVAALLSGEGGPRCTWSLIGHLQSRKAARAVALFDDIHSLDSVGLAVRLDRLAAARGCVLPVLVQVNISGEEAKHGLAASAWPGSAEQSAGLYAAFEAMLQLPHLDVQGLMTIAPLAADPEAVRPVFRRLRELRDGLACRFPAHPWQHLSMGMSDDYAVAVEEGATMIRLGRALFGPRS